MRLPLPNVHFNFFQVCAPPSPHGVMALGYSAMRALRHESMRALRHEARSWLHVLCCMPTCIFLVIFCDFSVFEALFERWVCWGMLRCWPVERP
jgi:hypothetical protein